MSIKDQAFSELWEPGSSGIWRWKPIIRTTTITATATATSILTGTAIGTATPGRSPTAMVNKSRGGVSIRVVAPTVAVPDNLWPQSHERLPSWRTLFLFRYTIRVWKKYSSQ